MKQKVFIGADHRGFELKAHLISALDQEYKLVDCGATTYDAEDDYPDYAAEVCQKVLAEKGSLGILICGSGVGMSIAANRFKGIRAALVTNVAMARQSRRDDHANVLCLGQDVASLEANEQFTRIWLQTGEGDAERYIRRIKKIDTLV